MGAKSKNKHFQNVVDLQRRINAIEKDIKNIGDPNTFRNKENYQHERNKLRQKYDIKNRFDSLDKLIGRLKEDIKENKQQMAFKYVADPRHFFLSEKLPKPSNTKKIGYIFNPNYNANFDPTSEISLAKQEEKNKLKITPKTRANNKLKVDQTKVISDQYGSVQDGDLVTEGPNGTLVLIERKNRVVNDTSNTNPPTVEGNTKKELIKQKAPSDLAWADEFLPKGHTLTRTGSVGGRNSVANNRARLILSRAQDINRAYGGMNDEAKKGYLSNPRTQLEIEA